jgi:hypothetical protein
MTTDHEEIRHWVEEHGGKPANVKGHRPEVEPDVLRIELPGLSSSEEQLEYLPWDTWFEIFDRNGLAFLYHAAA